MDTKRRNSRKRTAILEALCSAEDHPTAETLYSRLKPDYPELSLGTVYRNLAVLAEEGKVVSVTRVAGQERYDARTQPHAHFVCRCCRRVMDLELPNMINPMYSLIDSSLDCQAEEFSLTIKGLCGACRTN